MVQEFLNDVSNAMEEDLDEGELSADQLMDKIEQLEVMILTLQSLHVLCFLDIIYSMHAACINHFLCYFSSLPLCVCV